MIYSHTDFIEELSKLHPDVKETSLEIIIRKGLKGINRIMRENGELVINGMTDGTQDWIKFLIPMSPEEQSKHSYARYLKKERKKQRLLNTKAHA